MEIIDQTVISPLVSKCRIKVCYVGEQPNRNHTVITREVAEEMGRKLPGSPIVGYYNEDTKDFEQHNREIDVSKGKFRILDTTKPYGFVAPDAKVWFEKFTDTTGEHEYLCTEGYLWTGAYPESKRIIDKGNNQSMELNKDAPGFWTNDINSGDRIFIYNEALIEKLCILGEEYEPCFEGAQITAFALDRAEFEEFKTHMFSVISELQEAVKGGSSGTMDVENKEVVPAVEDQDPVDPNYVKKPDEDEKEKNQDSEGKSDKEDNQNSDSKTEEQEKEEPEKKDDEEEDKKKKYSLEDVVEYQELKTQFDELTNNYTALESNYNNLVSEKSTLEQEVESLRQFKLETEKTQKQAMIDSFYMLSDEDKKDVVENINTYSLDDIEAKLSVICVRNKLNLAEGQNTEKDAPSMFSLESAADSDTAPAWIKAVRENNK